MLRWAIGLCLVGHGGVALFTHAGWAEPFVAIGLVPADATAALAAAAGFEIALGVAVFVTPVTPVLVIAGAWKLATEALRLPAGEPVWEVVERGGADAAPWLLLLLQRDVRRGSLRPGS